MRRGLLPMASQGDESLLNTFFCPKTPFFWPWALWCMAVAARALCWLESWELEGFCAMNLFRNKQHSVSPEKGI